VASEAALLAGLHVEQPPPLALQVDPVALATVRRGEGARKEEEKRRERTAWLRIRRPARAQKL
jgi:hypothetical protein